MRLSMEHERLVRMIKESIALMCKSSLSYDLELNVEGLLGITLDKKDIVLVNINESFQTETSHEHEHDEQESSQKQHRQREVTGFESDVIGIKNEGESLMPCRKKKRKSKLSSDQRHLHMDDAELSPHLHSMTTQFETSSSQATHLNDQQPMMTEYLPVDFGVSDNSAAAVGSKDNVIDLDFDDIVIKQEEGMGLNGCAEKIDIGLEDQRLYLSPTSLTEQASHHSYSSQQMSDCHQGHGTFPGINANMSEGHGSHSGPVYPGTTKPDHYRCICGKAYIHLNHLQRHQQQHTAPAYACGICAKLFHRKDVCKRHESQHDGELPVRCDDNHDNRNSPMLLPTQAAPTGPQLQST